MGVLPFLSMDIQIWNLMNFDLSLKEYLKGSSALGPTVLVKYEIQTTITTSIYESLCRDQSFTFRI